MKVRDICNALNELAPFDNCCAWDNCGLITGDADADVTGVYVTLDADMYALKKAKENGCNTVISHHPIVFDALKRITPDDSVYHYIKNGVSVISAHTCLDSAKDGVSETLAKLCGLEDITEFVSEGIAIGRSGTLTVTDTDKYVTEIKSKLCTDKADILTMCPVRRAVAVSGSGGSMISEIHARGFDTLITGEAHHEHFVYAENNGLNIFAFGHFETERIIISPLCEKMRKKINGVKFIPSDKTEFVKRR